MFKAIKKSSIDEKVIAIKYLEAIEKAANGESNTIILPYDTASQVGVFSGIGQSMGIMNKKTKR
jgi:hypothetical protein